MKTVIIVLVTLVCTSFIWLEPTVVYICKSPKAKKYHLNKNCPGLQRCTHTIESVTKDNAVKLGYSVCKKE